MISLVNYILTTLQNFYDDCMEIDLEVDMGLDEALDVDMGLDEALDEALDVDMMDMMDIPTMSSRKRKRHQGTIRKRVRCRSSIRKKIRKEEPFVSRDVEMSDSTMSRKRKHVSTMSSFDSISNKKFHSVSAKRLFFII